MTFSDVDTGNGTGIAAQLLQATGDGIKLLQNHAETILLESTFLYSDAFRYLPQSQTLIVLVNAVKRINPFYEPSFDGFLFYHVDLELGVTYVGNATVHNRNGCTSMPAQIMEIGGNLFTIMDGFIKKSSPANPLSNEDWEFADPVGCPYYLVALSTDKMTKG